MRRALMGGGSAAAARVSAAAPLRLPPLVVPALAFLSGACALVYQVVWVRQAALLLGVTSWAVASVLATFMGGLGLGALLFGRASARGGRDPLRLWAALEIGAGLAALLVPFGWQALAFLLPALAPQIEEHAALSPLLRFLAVALVLGLPTTLLGGTLPALAAAAARTGRCAARDVGRLYAAETLGAVTGCLLAGFHLVAEHGLLATLRGAAAVHVALGLTAFALARARPLAPPAASADAPASAAAPEPSRGRRRLARTVLFVSGFCALGYEVLWTRVLVFYLHNSTYAFSTMLACVLLGIGLGSLLAARRAERTRTPLLLLAGVQVGVGVLVVLALHVYLWLPHLAASFAEWQPLDTWWKAATLLFGMAAAVLLPMSLCLGAAFPAAVRVGTGGPLGPAVGALSAANTLGGIAGSLAVAFVLLPRLELVGTFRLLVAANLAAALLVVVVTPELRAAPRWLAAFFVLLLSWGSGRVVPEALFREAFRAGEALLYYRDDAADTVMVRAPNPDSPTRWLVFSDGRGTAGTPTNPMNRFYGHLPLLLHGDARRVLSIALGTGNTLAAIVEHPSVERIDAVELSAAALGALPWFPTNERAWEDPRVHLTVQDGRNFLLASRERWDVVQLEPPEIHTAGVVNLYTREFYELARAHLSPGGLLCQWANVSLMSVQAQRMLVATFLEVFPHGTLWMPLQSLDYVLLLGGEQPLAIHYERLRRRWESGPVADDLREVVGLAGVLDLLACFKLGPYGARRFCGEVPILTDDRTLVDFLVPRSRDAHFGLMNAFSGLRLPVQRTLPGQRRYVADKLEVLRRASESVFPYLEGFADDREAASVRQSLWRHGEWFQERAAERIERIELGIEPPVGY